MHYRANIENVVWRILDGEAVLVHAGTSAYYGLNSTATCAWEALVSAAVTREDLSQRLSVCYGRDVNTLRSDVDALVAALAAESLIVGSPTPADDAANASRPGNVLRSQNGYEPPALSRFGELEKLVLSGE